MADTEDAQKAERLAAAKKRVEQLKKSKAKKGGAVKKKDDKVEAEPTKPEEPKEKPKEESQELLAEEAPIAADGEHDQAAVEEAQGSPLPTAKPSHGRQPSVSIQSKLRSESFRKASGSGTPTSPNIKSPTLPFDSLSIGEEAQGVFRKQTSRIDELERENKRLQIESQDAEARWRKLEEELQELREASSDAVELKSKADMAEQKGQELEKLKSELASLQRQNTQLQTAASKRRQSTSSPNTLASSDDLTAQLASKSETISSLELEISSLHSKVNNAQSVNDTLTAKVTALETSLQKSEHAAESTSTELADLKANLDKASERAVAEGSSRSSAETKIAQLQAEIGTAQRSASEATKRAETLEKKVETLTTLHRESDARTQSKLNESQKSERDAKELRARVTALSNENARLLNDSIRRKKMEAEGDSAGLEELEDEERLALATKVRELEEEVSDLRRGVWRDKRRELQPGLDDTNGFDDVDLSGTPTSKRPPVHSTFSDVINSGINAFTGGVGRRGSNATGARPAVRKQSLGLLSEDEDDFAFDEDAFRKAQEDEQKARLERIKDMKRGLKDWQGWRVDVADLRAGMGGVFEV